MNPRQPDPVRMYAGSDGDEKGTVVAKAYEGRPRFPQVTCFIDPRRTQAGSVAALFRDGLDESRQPARSFSMVSKRALCVLLSVAALVPEVAGCASGPSAPPPAPVFYPPEPDPPRLQVLMSFGDAETFVGNSRPNT